MYAFLQKHSPALIAWAYFLISMVWTFFGQLWASFLHFKLKLYEEFDTFIDLIWFFVTAIGLYFAVRLIKKNLEKSLQKELMVNKALRDLPGQILILSENPYLPLSALSSCWMKQIGLIVERKSF